MILRALPLGAESGEAAHALERSSGAPKLTPRQLFMSWESKWRRFMGEESEVFIADRKKGARGSFHKEELGCIQQCKNEILNRSLSALLGLLPHGFFIRSRFARKQGKADRLQAL